MAHVSKLQLKKEHLEQLFGQLNRIIGKLDHNSSEDFFSELLGKEEQIMLAKRFAAIVMLIEENSIYRISQLLLMSPSTVERIKLNLELGRYRTITLLLKKNKRGYEQFWTTLEIILRAGMPPQGRGRWKSIFEQI